MSNFFLFIRKLRKLRIFLFINLRNVFLVNILNYNNYVIRIHSLFPIQNCTDTVDNKTEKICMISFKILSNISKLLKLNLTCVKKSLKLQIISKIQYFSA